MTRCERSLFSLGSVKNTKSEERRAYWNCQYRHTTNTSETKLNYNPVRVRFFTSRSPATGAALTLGISRAHLLKQA